MLSLPPAYVVRREGNSFTLFVCPHLGGGGGSGPAGRSGGGVSGPARGGVRSSRWGVRSSWGGGQVQLAGWGQVQLAGGGVSILGPLVGGMPLAFTQEDFLVVMYVFCVFSDAFMINLGLVLGFTAYITLYPFQWLEDLLEVCSQTISRNS